MKQEPDKERSNAHQWNCAHKWVEYGGTSEFLQYRCKLCGIEGAHSSTERCHHSWEFDFDEYRCVKCNRKTSIYPGGMPNYQPIKRICGPRSELAKNAEGLGVEQMNCELSKARYRDDIKDDQLFKTSSMWKAAAALIGFVIFILVANGCATTGVLYDDVKREPTTSVDVFQEGQKPSKPYKEIGTVNREDFGGEESNAVRDLIKQAKAQGANAIILQPRQDTGYEFSLFSRSGNRYMYKAISVVYEPTGNAR